MPPLEPPPITSSPTASKVELVFAARKTTRSRHCVKRPTSVDCNGETAGPLCLLTGGSRGSVSVRLRPLVGKRGAVSSPPATWWLIFSAFMTLTSKPMAYNWKSSNALKTQQFSSMKLILFSSSEDTGQTKSRNTLKTHLISLWKINHVWYLSSDGQFNEEESFVGFSLQRDNK